MTFVRNIDDALSALTQQINLLQDKANSIIEPFKDYKKYPDLKDFSWSLHSNNSIGTHNLNTYLYFSPHAPDSWIDVQYTDEMVEKGINHYWETYNQWKAACEPILEENRLIKEHNDKQVKQITAIMKTIGLGETYYTYEYKTKRSKNKTQISNVSGWKKDLERILPKDNYLGIEKSIISKGKSIESYGKEMNKKYKEEMRLKKREEEEKRRVEALAFLGARYLSKPSSDLDDVLDVILSKNKYLRLAHFLKLNRMDWNDGYSYADIGLYGFKPESDQDKQIEEEITEIIVDGTNSGEIDGRMFRDCEWNYDVLFGMVDDEKLMEDYELICRFIDS